MHLATGNYNDSTAKLYTDCGIFTCDERFGEDATAVFNMLVRILGTETLESSDRGSDLDEKPFPVSLIEREAEHAKQGLPACIRRKDEFAV